MKSFVSFFIAFVTLGIIISCERESVSTEASETPKVDDSEMAEDIVGPFFYFADFLSSLVGISGNNTGDGKIEIELYPRWFDPNERGVSQPAELTSYLPFGAYIEIGSKERKKMGDYEASIRGHARDEMLSSEYSTAPPSYINLLEIFNAGILDGASITADMEIYGREPGTNIADLFILSSTNSHFHFTYPDYNYKTYYPKNVSKEYSFLDYYSAGTVLSLGSKFVLEYQGTSSNDVTITVNIPIQGVSGYSISGLPLPEWMEKPEYVDTLSNSITIRFQ